MYIIVGWDSSIIGDLLQPGQSGDWIPVGARFSAPVQTGPGVHPASYRMGTGSFPGVKQLGHGVDHPPPSTAKVKETVELYLYSPSGSLWSVVGWTLPFYLYTYIIRFYVCGIPQTYNKIMYNILHFTFLNNYVTNLMKVDFWLKILAGVVNIVVFCCPLQVLFIVHLKHIVMNSVKLKF